MRSIHKRKFADVRLAISVVPVVIALVVCFFVLAQTVILDLSKKRMIAKSENYANYLDTWAGRILGELEIYKTTIDKEGSFDEHTFDVLSTSYGPHSEYPYGLYWGDEYSNFYDASGWDPGPTYVPSSRNWYIEGRNHSKFEFGEPYFDVRAFRPCVSATVRTDRDGVESVLAADIYFDYAEELVEKISAQEIEKAFFISGSTRMIIADTEREYTGGIIDTDIKNELYRSIVGLLDEKFTGLTRVKGNDVYYVNIIRIEDMDWYFVTCMKENAMLESIRRVIGYILITGVVGCMMLMFLTHRASEALSEANKEAKTDPLTRLLNRDGFNSAVKAFMKECPDQGVMLMFDIDNFKLVNDELGHQEGDEFLKEFAELLSLYFNRAGDISARMGGDEFAVFVGRKIGSSEVSSMLKKFIKRFHENFDEKYSGQNISVSIGASFVGEKGKSPEEVYRSTDKALYKVKFSGKNNFYIAD